MTNKEFRKIEEYMIGCMSDSAHDKEHVYRVLYIALDIAEHEENVNMDILLAACLLHDIGRKEQIEDPRVCHAEVGSKKAYEYLISIGWSDENAALVRECIYTHRFRNSNQPKSIEAKILFDADKVDVCGAMGMARSLIYRGSVTEPLYTLNDDTVCDGENTDEPSFFREYHYKLKKLYSRFFTERGAALAKERKKAAEDFYNSLLTESRKAYENGRERLKICLKEDK